MHPDVQELGERVKEESQFVDRLTGELGKVIVGQSYMIERLMIGLLCDGHILLEGVPGLAKTLTINSLSDAIDTKFQRLQFTPDLLPADLLGTLIYRQETGQFEIKKGPIFANIILADEINRAPAKVQSALLEAMQERQVTIGDTTYPLERPFLVLATQNPIEQEGTYPLPEAQVDRFMLKINVTYPTKREEREILDRLEQPNSIADIESIITPEDIIKARDVVNEIYIADKVKDYIINIINATRNPKELDGDIGSLIEFGASPRASIYLMKAAKAHAFLRHRGHVTPDDIKTVGADVLRHRVILTYEAEAEEISVDEVIRKIFASVEVP